MALKFGPQWLRDLSDGGTGSTQPNSPTLGTKFKLAEYRYGREEMLSLWNINSPPPDQVRKHLSIFSKENQKPITMMPLTEDEQRLISQGFNSTGVLRAAGRGSAPPLRVPRGGGTADRGRGRGRGRGEGYVPRMENGDIGYHRSQEGWEQVGRKLERSYSRGYEEGSTGTKREYSRSASDNNWREKRQDDEEDDEGGWRAPQSRDSNSRWGPSSRRDWRDPRDLSGFEGDRRPPLHHRRGFDQDLRGPRRISESHDNEGEVPEWVEDDIGDDPGTFDSSGAFVSTKDGRRHPDSRYEGGSSGDSEWRRKGPGGGTSSQNNHNSQEKSDQTSTSSGVVDKNQRKYVPPNARNGSGHGGRTDEIIDASQRENEDPPAVISLSKGDLPFDDSQNLKEQQRPNKDNLDDIERDFDFAHEEFVEGSGDVTSLYGQGHRLPQTMQLASKTTNDQQKPSTPALTTSLEAATGVDFLSSSAASVFEQPSSIMQSSKMDVGDLETHLASSSNRNRPPVDPAFAHVEKSLQNLVAQMTMDTEKESRPRDVSREALPLTHEHANKWFYKDPQGEIQGPFSNEEMAQWFGAGYFTMSLIVKRGCDDSFKQLGELIKRYGRVPFLPGTPLPPLITTGSAAAGESIPPSSVPATNQSSVASQSLSAAVSTTNSNILPTLPSVSSSLANPTAVPSMMNPMQDPLMQQMMLLQQEYIKQTYLMRQLQVQTLQQLHQEQENFASLPPDQQQHLAMQMIMRAHPLLMQQLHSIQQQQLLLQQQIQQQQQQLASQTSVSLGEEIISKSGLPPSHPVTSTVQASTAPSSSFPSSSTITSSIDENLTVWGSMLQQDQQQPPASVWSQVTSQPQAQPQTQPQPTSLWDVDSSAETLPPAYKAQMEKLKRVREEERLREEERQRQMELERKQEELRRQQEELEQQREQVLREKEELERQKQIDMQKREEARRKEEEARRLEDEKLQREIEKQQREQREAEKRRQEEEKRRQEEERKREKEMKKLEEKRRKEEEKRRLQEEQRRQEEIRRKQQEEEEARLLQLQVEEEQQRLQAEYEQLQQQREEEERIQREAAEKERAEMQRRQQQQLELQRQNESLRRLQQAQREQLANMQLPAHSNWADQQGGGPAQSRSLTEIQEEEARREQERLQRQQQELQKMQEQAFIMNQQHHQKSWATHAAQGLSNRGPSLLDIQQQEQENMKKNQKDKPKVATYQSKILQGASSSIWSGGPPSVSNSSGGVWESAGGVSSIWGSQPTITTQPARGRQQQPKESGEFPALKNPVQQNKKSAAVKANSNKTGKTAGSKQKKEEETVQKLFQTRQQDDFTQWVTDRVSRFSAQIDVPTFVSFIVEVDSPDDVRDYMVSYLGDNKEARDFARQFVEKRNRSRNQARLEKQQEEDSIWGPAPAINPHIQTRPAASNSGSGDAGEGNGSAGGKGSKNRKKKQKMQKLDGSILGFTVHSDPNRKNAAGELEGVQ